MIGDLFAPQEAADIEARRESVLRSSWDAWGWPGPAVGRLCDIDLPIVDTVEGSALYCYTEQALLVEQRVDGRWIAEIEMPGDWYKNGRRVVLDRHWIGPPRRILGLRREAA